MGRKSFMATLRDLRAGEVEEQLDAGLQQLVQQVQRTAKGGKITIVVEVKPMKGSTEAVIVKATVTVKEPKFEDNGSVMFPTPEGNLTRSSFKQDDLPGITLAASTPAPVAAAGHA